MKQKMSLKLRLCFTPEDRNIGSYNSRTEEKNYKAYIAYPTYTHYHRGQNNIFLHNRYACCTSDEQVFELPICKLTKLIIALCVCQPFRTQEKLLKPQRRMNTQLHMCVCVCVHRSTSFTYFRKNIAWAFYRLTVYYKQIVRASSDILKRMVYVVSMISASANSNKVKQVSPESKLHSNNNISFRK